MESLVKLTEFLDDELRIAEIPDYSGALNGLQLQNGGEVGKVAAAVDASLPVIEKAVAAGATLLLVHHGMFWQGAQRIEGAFYRKIRAAMDAGLAIYSAHLPLDVHPQWGNNALLARELEFGAVSGFLDWKGLAVGLRAEIDEPRDALLGKVGQAVGGRALLCPGGPERVQKVGLCTGGAGSQVADAAAAGVDTFITGEGPHWSFSAAEELGINVIYAGHYATETFGVKALAGELKRRFGLPWEFIDHPTGL